MVQAISTYLNDKMFDPNWHLATTIFTDHIPLLGTYIATLHLLIFFTYLINVTNFTELLEESDCYEQASCFGGEKGWWSVVGRPPSGKNASLLRACNKCLVQRLAFNYYSVIFVYTS